MRHDKVALSSEKQSRANMTMQVRTRKKEAGQPAQVRAAPGRARQSKAG